MRLAIMQKLMYFYYYIWEDYQRGRDQQFFVENVSTKRADFDKIIRHSSTLFSGICYEPQLLQRALPQILFRYQAK